MIWRRPLYYVALDNFHYLRGGYTNFIVCKTKEHAMQVLKRNPHRGQIDVRGAGKPFCWKYWKRGRIITQ